MIDAIRELTRLVASDADSKAVIERLGTRIATGQGRTVATVRPRRDDFESMTVNPATVDGVDFVIVEVRLSRDTALTIAQLARVFGRYQPLPPADPFANRHFAFKIDYRDEPHVCTLVAEAAGMSEDEAERRVLSILARRDPRTGS